MIHPSDCECETYGCQLRRKGLNLSSTASPTMRVRRPWRPKVEGCSWEAGIATEARPGGFRMPYVDPSSGRRIRMKESVERRREISDLRQRRAQGATKE